MTTEALRTVSDPSAPLTARRMAWLHLKSARGQRVRQWRTARRNAVDQIRDEIRAAVNGGTDD